MTSRQRTPRSLDERDTGKHGDRRGGMPGDGVGRREEPGTTGVHPASAGWPDQEMAMRSTAEWGQGERGHAGDEDSGRSELSPPTGAAEASGKGVAGQPGPADESNAALETHPRAVAGAPGPSDEAKPAVGTRSRPVAGAPGPADESNPALETEGEGE